MNEEKAYDHCSRDNEVDDNNSSSESCGSNSDTLKLQEGHSVSHTMNSSLPHVGDVNNLREHNRRRIFGTTTNLEGSVSSMVMDSDLYGSLDIGENNSSVMETSKYHGHSFKTDPCRLRDSLDSMEEENFDNQADDDALLEIAIQESIETMEKSALAHLNSESHPTIYTDDATTNPTDFFDEEFVDMKDKELRSSCFKDDADEAALIRQCYNKSAETASSDQAPEALSSAQDAISNREKSLEEQKVITAAQFASLTGEFPDDLLRKARIVYDELLSKQRNNGGSLPTIEYALSVAQDQAKEGAKQSSLDKTKESVDGNGYNVKETRKQYQNNKYAGETRQQRAERFAAIADKRRNKETS